MRRMSATNGCVGRVRTERAVVLMARIVDGAGRPMRPSDIRAIEYSAVGSSAGVRGAAVDVGDVVFDALQTDGAWSVDEVGDNFRHKIDVGRLGGLPRCGDKLQLCYVFTLASGGQTIVRFRIG
jgi:hypothetical protein